MRAIIHAPVARNLEAEQSSLAIIKLQGATNGVRQAWCTAEGDKWAALADVDIVVLTKWKDVPLALKKHCALVRRSDTLPPLTNVSHRLWADLGTTDFVRTWSTLTGTRLNIGPITVKAASTLLSTDRFHPEDLALAHRWLGVDDSPLGEPDV